jgi:hypothetical protein
LISIFIYLLKLGFYPVTMVGRLVDSTKRRNDKQNSTKQYKTKKTQNRAQKYKTKNEI